MGGEVNITYETLFELLRREKSREELQPLEENFMDDVKAYLAEKKVDFGDGQKTIFSEEENEKLKVQLESINKVLKELYSRREKKILSMAVTKARANSIIIDTSAMAREEKELFESITAKLLFFRQRFDSEVINLDIPKSREPEKAPGPAPEPTVAKEEKQPSAEPEKSLETVPKGPEKASKQAKQPEIKEKKEIEPEKQAEDPKEEPSGNSMQMVRFTHHVPKFVGKELEVYGPFEPEEITTLPSEIANVLIKKGRAEEMKES